MARCANTTEGPAASSFDFKSVADETPRKMRLEQKDFSKAKSQIGKVSKYRANRRGVKLGR
jgi:hypothetical protein